MAWAWTSTETGGRRRGADRPGQGEPVGEDEQDVGAADHGDRDTEGDAEERTGLGSDPEGVDSGFSDAATEGGDTVSG